MHLPNWTWRNALRATRQKGHKGRGKPGKRKSRSLLIEHLEVRELLTLGPPGVCLAHDTGVSSTDMITSNGALTLTGVASGATVDYSVNGGTTWNSGFTAGEGSNSVEVRQIVNGDTSPASSPFVFTLDTTAPAAPTIAGLDHDSGTDHTDDLTKDAC